jgi:microcystin-dependent protein
MSDPILGMIMLWPGNWVPYGWALCDGTQMPIQQNAALYSILGTIYGGNAITTFNLPNLNNRVAVGTSAATGVSQTGGGATASVNATGVGNVTINVNNLPAQTHTGTFSPSGSGSSVSIAIPVASGVSEAQSTTTPSNTTILANSSTSSPDAVTVYTTQPTNATLKPFDVAVPAGSGTVTNSNTGGGQALAVAVAVPVTVSTMQPYIKLNYVIATQGIYPQRE